MARPMSAARSLGRPPTVGPSLAGTALLALLLLGSLDPGRQPSWDEGTRSARIGQSLVSFDEAGRLAGWQELLRLTAQQLPVQQLPVQQAGPQAAQALPSGDPLRGGLRAGGMQAGQVQLSGLQQHLADLTLQTRQPGQLRYRLEGQSWAWDGSWQALGAGLPARASAGGSFQGRRMTAVVPESGSVLVDPSRGEVVVEGSATLYNGPRDAVALAQAGLDPALSGGKAWQDNIRVTTYRMLAAVQGRLGSWPRTMLLLALLSGLALLPTELSAARQQGRARAARAAMRTSSELIDDPDQRRAAERRIEREHGVDRRGQGINLALSVVGALLLIALWSAAVGIADPRGWLWIPDLSARDPLLLLPLSTLAIRGWLTLQDWQRGQLSRNRLIGMAPSLLVQAVVVFTMPALIGLLALASSAFDLASSAARERAIRRGEEEASQQASQQAGQQASQQ